MEETKFLVTEKKGSVYRDKSKWTELHGFFRPSKISVQRSKFFAIQQNLQLQMGVSDQNPHDENMCVVTEKLEFDYWQKSIILAFV